MKKVISICLFFCCLFLYSFGQEILTLQDFESKVSVDKYPSNKPGEVKISTEWKSNGTKSLRIDAGLMATFSQFKTRNWKSYDLLRIHFNNTGDTATTIGFELRDKHNGFRERHDNSFGIKAGVSVVELDISGALWRGEENKPYIGKIKTPIEMDLIKRIAFKSRSKSRIYIDQIELVKIKKIHVDGAFAFDFGKSKTQVMSQMIGITEKTKYSPKKGYGFEGNSISSIKKNMSFPTPLLGDGLSLTKAKFKVKLKAKKYIGLIAFERGGFWEDEWSSYSNAKLFLNNKVVHSHDFSNDGIDFLFQDTEILDLKNLSKKIIWPSHAIHQFNFSANNNENIFSMKTENSKGYPLRVAGLIIAPDTKEGKEFLDSHIARQKKTINTTFAAGDKSRRKNRSAPGKQLVVEELPVGEMVYPKDYPRESMGTKIEEKIAIAGQTYTFHLGLYSQINGSVNVSNSSNSVIEPKISYGRYMPMRNYGVGSVWLQVNHYRPGLSFSIGPNATRSLVVEYKIPADFDKSLIKDTILISMGKNKISLPIQIKVAKVPLESIPIPVGLFMNSLPINQELMDPDIWWKLQASLLEEQMSSGLTALSGGRSINYKISKNLPIKITGNNAIKYIKLAQKYGPIHAIVGYGGFFGGVKRLLQNANEIGKAVLEFEKKNNLPIHYINSFDEPRSGTDELSRVLKYLGIHKNAGLRTIGWSGWDHKHAATGKALSKASYAVALNHHNDQSFDKVKALGAEPWAYNNGLSRFGLGLRLWRSIKLGAKGRMEWIGLFTQGFAFHNLDGREPSKSSFLVHKQLGVLKTPVWLGAREGLLDVRIRLTLEKMAKKDDPILNLWSLEGYQKDKDLWTNTKLNNTKIKMLKRILELSQ